VQGFPALEFVPNELQAIQNLHGGRVLLDGAFRADRLEGELREHPPGVLHIASHAQFTGDPRTSFILAHDRKLTMGELARLVESNRFGEAPLELLVLSACETAAGDDRSALGLAGLAIRAGARSAVGSLWTVDDEATSQLILGFYSNLQTSSVSRAKALALSQRELIEDPRYEHPFYWAGFMLINSWL
jgi:CHAT domain-containing protein